ncbi:MAG: hypothetical protein IT245_04380 [Bacteroidia bacterium]|nr:hypothetical protein [Bacteroidia bacterium]
MTISILNPTYTYHFITIVTKRHKHFFGEKLNGNMKYSEVGIIANIIWNEIANNRENLIRDEYIVMPNHIHGILMVNKLIKVNTHLSKDHIKYDRHESYIENIIKLYKSTVKKYTNKFNLEFAWHPNYHSRYIQAESGLIAIRRYIQNNITKWNK